MKRGTLGLDDAFITAATVAQCAQAAAIFLALNRGAGTAFTLLSASNVRNVGLAIYSANTLYILSLALSKASVICLLMRLFNLAYTRACHSSRFLLYRQACLSALGLTAAWAIGSIIGLTVNCEGGSFLSEEQTCPAQTTRWAVIMGIDVFLEVLLVAMTIINVLPLQLSKSTKGQIIISFAFRLLCVAFSVLHFHYIQRYNIDSSDGLNLVQVLNMMQIDLCWSIVSATIPNLKAFVKSFNSGFGLGVDVATAYFGTMPHSAVRRDYELSQMKSAQASQQHSYSRSIVEREQVDQASAQPNHRQPGSASSLDSQDKGHERNLSITSDSSRERIIRKDIQWTVAYDHTHKQ